jgi:hypothetical protein
MFNKKYLLFFSLFILGVLLITSCLLKPPVTEGILKGQVIVPEGSVQAKGLTGQALPDATVNIIDLSTGDIIATTTTDANGYYQVFVPAGGPYLLEAVKAGVKLEQITCSVEVGIEYNLGTVDCVTTAAALIAQAMMDAGDNPADINCANIVADPDFDDVMSIVCTIIKAGGDPTESTLVQQAIEDFLYPPEPTPTPTAAVIDIAVIPGVTAPVTGATPVTTITATAQYTGTVAWAPADDPFLGNQAYTATIAITAKAGFTLTGVALDFFTVAGATATNPINSGVVTAVFPATLLVVGASYGGGKVAYILQSGDTGYDANKQHGLIAATADQSTGIAWSNITGTLVGTTGTAIGTGQTNTTAIVGQGGCTSGAAWLCNDLTEGGYSDWYLPSKNELNKLYLNQVVIGSFAGDRYWSSSEGDAYYAWDQDFSDGYQYLSNKSSHLRVRAVRAF